MQSLHLFVALITLATSVFARSVEEFGPPVEQPEIPTIPSSNELLHQLQNRCNSCDRRYFLHYEAKHCQPVYEEGCECPVRFNCPDEPASTTVCEFKGKTYSPRDHIETPNPCEICNCELDYFTSKPTISCISVECGHIFRPPPADGCYDVFVEGQCCPTDVKCLPEAELNNTGVILDVVVPPSCEFEGKTYQWGQRMYSDEDPCLICLCNDEFHDKSSNSCHIHDCGLEKKRNDLQAGCVPVYHEKTCCPIEFHCPSGIEEIVPNHSVPYASDNETDPINQCTFAEKSANIGDELDIKHPTNCVTCTCLTPPEFTCVHKACPRPPNDDYENCYPIVVPGRCCSTYQCRQMSAPLQCAPVHCQENCVEVSVPHGCPMCECQDVLCSMPKCSEGCEIDYNVPLGSCPTCKCSGVAKMQRPICDPVKCSPQCFEGVSPQGCPMCVCGPLCSPPKCEEGCHIQTTVAEGQCPGCECPDNATASDFDVKIFCSPVKCPPMCREVMGNAGCPMCQCDPMCSPPKCLPGCHIESPPYAGPCPGCVCGEKEKLTDIQCAPVKCEQGCHEVLIPNGCSMCQCASILCSPPKCQEGCTVETEFPPGGCPGCKCPPSMPLDRPMCGPVKCGPQCHEGISPQGCPMCVCGPLCSPPKCDEGCRIQTEVPDGQCPGCVCDTDVEHRDLSKIQCSPVMCPPSCHKTIGDSGCEKCECFPLCSPPKCAPGCRVESIPSSGPCPGCVCDSATSPQVQCYPVRCESDCRQVVDFSQSPCPFCVCDKKNEEFRAYPSRIQCSPPKCEPGCFPKLIPPGPCPSCSCGDQGGPSFGLDDVQCSPPKCQPGCFPKLIPPGPCPSCSCGDQGGPSFGLDDVQCSPPKCQPGCFPKLIPPGPCPSCSCGDQDGPSFGLDDVQCSPPKCQPGCFPKLIPPGPCPSCSCGDQGGPSFGFDDVQCSPPKCEPGCFPKLIPPGPCPSCSCGDQGGPSFGFDGVQCSPPKCQPGCFPKLIPPGPCPSCSCGDQGGPSFGLDDVQCSPVKCDPGCHEETDPSQGPCPKCVCGRQSFRPLTGIQCGIPKCDPGCYPKARYPGSCPTCFCEGSSQVPHGIRCSAPRCKAGCFPKIIPPGPCPTCSCGDQDGSSVGTDVQCAPVKCDPGCYPETDPSRGPCPSCVCGNQRFRPLTGMQCAMPRCNPGCYPKVTPPGRCATCFCREGGRVGGLECPQMECQLPCRRVSLTPNGCPMCICDKAPMCATPKCEPGCKSEIVSPGGCPECVCTDETTDELKCPQLQCLLPCRSVLLTPNSCPMCICDNAPMCTMPKCDPGCTPEIVSPGGCHECVCSDKAKVGTTPAVHCDPVKCGSTCREATDQFGCPTCLCDPMCSPPVCSPGCGPKLVLHAGPCPVCSC